MKAIDKNLVAGKIPFVDSWLFDNEGKATKVFHYSGGPTGYRATLTLSKLGSGAQLDLTAEGYTSTEVGKIMRDASNEIPGGKLLPCSEVMMR
jgi:hypothetical protein